VNTHDKIYEDRRDGFAYINDSEVLQGKQNRSIGKSCIGGKNETNKENLSSSLQQATAAISH
jgi:hypothetical protein